MPDTNQGTEAGGTPLWRRRRFWLAGGGILTGLAALAAVAPRASAYRVLAGHGFGGHGRHGFGAQILNDPAAAKQHAGMAVEWALRGVNGTEEQKQHAKRITDRLIDQIGPLVEKHREHREAMARELAKPEIDREALERLRREEIALADQASTLAVVVAVLVLLEVLLGAAWWHGPGMRDEARLAEGVAETAGEVLPGPERPAAELQSALDRLAPRFGLEPAVFSPAGERLARVPTGVTSGAWRRRSACSRSRLGWEPGRSCAG